MSIKVVYKEASDHGRTVREFLHDFKRRTGYDIEVLDPETRQGTEITRVYDIVEYPTIIALAERGEVRNMWRGLPLPTIDEVSYYV